MMLLELEGMQNGVFMSTHFKTKAVYHHQPVTIPLLLEVYIKYFRQGTSDMEEVFLTTDGTPMEQGYINKGKHIILCYLCYCLPCVTIYMQRWQNISPSLV